MEVHTHTHTPRKKWPHYFWEFLMLFLAVFCGFLAEYQLEHKIEKDREKKFIKSMLDDLKRDTLNFRVRLNQSLLGLRSCDTVMNLLQPEIKKDQTASMYYHARLISMKSPPSETFDRTYSQMKSSGNLRLLPGKIADSVTSYYFTIANLSFQNDYIHDLVIEYFRNVSVVFDGTVFQKMWNAAGLHPLDSLKPPQGNPPLADENKSSISRLIASMHFWYARIAVIRNTIATQNNKAIRLIKPLQEEYNLN